jgi:hypothetical protein
MVMQTLREKLDIVLGLCVTEYSPNIIDNAFDLRTFTCLKT